MVGDKALFPSHLLSTTKIHVRIVKMPPPIPNTNPNVNKGPDVGVAVSYPPN
jgi:hypothetical protein